MKKEMPMVLRSTHQPMGITIEYDRNIYVTGPHSGTLKLKSVQSALSDLKRHPERLQSQCNYRPFIT